MEIDQLYDKTSTSLCVGHIKYCKVCSCLTRARFWYHVGWGRSHKEVLQICRAARRIVCNSVATQTDQNLLSIKCIAPPRTSRLFLGHASESGCHLLTSMSQPFTKLACWWKAWAAALAVTAMSHCALGCFESELSSFINFEAQDGCGYASYQPQQMAHAMAGAESSIGAPAFSDEVNLNFSQLWCLLTKDVTELIRGDLVAWGFAGPFQAGISCFERWGFRASVSISSLFLLSGGLPLKLRSLLAALGHIRMSCSWKCPDMQEDDRLEAYVLRHQAEHEGRMPCWEDVADEVFDGLKSSKSCRLSCVPSFCLLCLPFLPCSSPLNVCLACEMSGLKHPKSL